MQRMAVRTFLPPPPAENDGEDLSNVEVVEKSNPKIQRRKVGTERGRGSDTTERSAKRTSARSAKKHQSQLLTTPASSTKMTSSRSTNKQQSQILFISTSKVRTKNTVSSTIRRKRQIATHNGDSDDNDGGNVERGASAGWGTASSHHTRRLKRSRR